MTDLKPISEQSPSSFDRAKAEHAVRKVGESWASRYAQIHFHLSMGTWELGYKGRKDTKWFAYARNAAEASLMSQCNDIVQDGFNHPDNYKRFAKLISQNPS